MEIVKDLLYLCSIIFFTIYVHIEKRNSYNKGFFFFFYHYSDMVEEVLHHTNQWNKEAEENGTPVTAHIESIKPLNYCNYASIKTSKKHNKAESEVQKKNGK